MRIDSSRGPIELGVREWFVLRRVLSGQADLAESQGLYRSVSARGLPFPLEWEAAVLRASLRELPDRADLGERLELVMRQLAGSHLEEQARARVSLLSMLLQAFGRRVPVRAPATDASVGRTSRAGGLQSAWERAWTRFAGASLIGHASSEAAEAARAGCFADACELLSSPHFETLSASRRTEVLLALHDTLMSAPSPDLTIVADLGLRQFRRLLKDPALTDAQAMGIYDCLHGMYFAGVSDVIDLRRFDSIVPLFERWLLNRHLAQETKASRPVDDRLTIAYLLHTGHFDRGNAVSPLVVSLANLHAEAPGRRVYLYLVQHVGPGFLRQLEGARFTVRSFPQDRGYSRIDEIAASLRKDGVDVIITDQNRAIASALFVRRCAGLQMHADTGFPYWDLRALDWTLTPVDTGTANSKHSLLAWRQAADSLALSTDAEAIARVRGPYPKVAFLLGVFTRLIKLNDRFFDLLNRILSSDPVCHLIIAGPGDPTEVIRFVAESSHANRIKFINENVDLNVYGQVIDVMCDTFPFIGGNACREVAAHGTPVVAKLGTPWDSLLRQDRSPNLLARDEVSYVDTVLRLRRDKVFMAAERQLAKRIFEKQTNPGLMVDEVEAGIEQAYKRNR